MALEQVCDYIDLTIHQTADAKSQVTRLFEAHGHPLYRYLVTLIGESGAAEEIAQEVFLKLYEHLSNGIRIANVRSWSYKVAHNLAIDFVRGQKRNAAGGDLLWTGLAETRADASPNPEARVLSSEQSAHLQAALAALPVQQRACLLLRAQGFRYREIAQMLGVAVPTVGECLRRGIRRLMLRPNFS